ncbi:MAG: cell division protein ZapA [Flavobacteriales bacterium]|jgi:cell division protein ZapA
MSEANRAAVTLLDKEYLVACQPEERAALLAASQELDRRMREIRSSGSIIGLERIAIMVALNLCHDLQQSHGKPTEDNNDNTALERLAAKLDKALS